MPSAAGGAGFRKMRPRAMRATASDPAAIPRANRALIAASTSTPPPVASRTTTGTSDSATAPVSQNQESARPASQRNGSARKFLRSEAVEAKTFALIARFGAATVVGGMKQLAMKQAAAIPIS